MKGTNVNVDRLVILYTLCYQHLFDNDTLKQKSCLMRRFACNLHKTEMFLSYVDGPVGLFEMILNNLFFIKEDFQNKWIINVPSSQSKLAVLIFFSFFFPAPNNLEAIMKETCTSREAGFRYFSPYYVIIRTRAV